MDAFRLVLKNYRCFSDESPLSVEIAPGFTALVGPNNSGKSTLLKFFRELRPTISILADVGHLKVLSGGGQVSAGSELVEDQAELGHNGNARPITIEIAHPNPRANMLASVQLSCERGHESMWRGRLAAGSDRRRLTGPAKGSDQARFTDESGTEVLVDVKWLRSVATSLQQCVYIGPFRNAVSENTGTYYELQIGTAFIGLWAEWKTGPQRQQNAVAQQVERDIASVFGFDRLEINASSDRRTLHVVVDGRAFRLRELGSGLAQFIVVLANVAIRKPTYLLIDEPELNLHPALQLSFLSTLASYTSHGVLFATHSLGLARAAADRIYSFTIDGSRRRVQPIEGLRNLAEFLGEMSFSAFRELGATKLLLVEGVHDLRTVQQFLRQRRKDHQIVMLPLGGAQLIRGGVQHELQELCRLANDVCVLIDSERTNDGGTLSADRQAFVDECAALGIPVHVTSRRAIENYLSDGAVKAVKGPGYSSLTPYQCLADASPAWSKAENWRIAREMRLEELSGTDLGQFLEKL